MEDGRRTPIYHLLHGAPMLGGIPAHYVLVLLGVATVFGLGAMSVSKAVGIAVLGAIVVAWMALAFVYGQDRARVPLMLLQLRYRFARRLDSYSPSRVRARIEEED
ncbi:MAG: VirB3 family type IV secretion system protein [Polyangia bacterium]